MKLRKPTRPFPVADRWRDGTPIAEPPVSPRLRVLTLQEGRIAAEGPLRPEDSPVLRIIDEARAAYDRRYPGCVFDQEVR